MQNDIFNVENKIGSMRTIDNMHKIPVFSLDLCVSCLIILLLAITVVLKLQNSKFASFMNFFQLTWNNAAF